MPIKVTIDSVGSGKCSLTGKDDVEGVSIAFEGETPCFLSKKAFWQILSMKAAQLPKAKVDVKPAPPAAPPALPQNGAPVVAK